MAESLYGPQGFYRRPEGPARHFRTSVTASPRFAEAVRALAVTVDATLGHPEPFDLVDLGAGRGELLDGVATLGVPDRWRLTGVEVADRPAGLRQEIAWTGAVPPLTGLLVANEWLDNVPLNLVEAGRLVLVDRAGREQPGPVPSASDQAWLDRWWPTGSRAEIGRTRDEAWVGAVSQVRAGVAVAMDYAHGRDGRPPGPTLTGYRRGRAVPPVPDGNGDLTAHVALDACAAAAPATSTMLTSQRAALRALGVVGSAPSTGASIEALERAGREAELLDPAGLGGFWWLVQAVGCPLPPPLPGLPPPSFR